jgi:leucyl aminopeptidase (aminopeptidase T)
MRELKASAHVALTDCADVKKGENVVILTDELLKDRGLAFWEAARELGADAIYCEIIPRSTNGEEPPKAVAALLRDCDVFMIPTSKSLSHTDARRQACANGARGATLPNITVDTMKRTLRADYAEIEARTKRIAGLLEGAREARVTTALGTDITMSLEGRDWKEDTGIVRTPGTFTNLPAGETYIAPIEGTAEGRMVTDGSCAGVGVIKEPISIDVSGGLATDISGGKEADTLKKIIAPFGEEGRNIAELGIGTNDKAQLVGSTLEDEKVLGTVHIALGDNQSMGGNVAVASHLDLIIKAPTLVVDGKEIIRAGEWVV